MEPTDLQSVLNQISSLDESQVRGMVQTLSVGGGSSFSIANIIAWVIFGVIGTVGIIYGKKNSNWRMFFIGILISAYPYFIRDTIWLYVIGIALSVLMFTWRD